MAYRSARGGTANHKCLANGFIISAAAWGNVATVLYGASPPGPGDVLPGLRAAGPSYLMGREAYSAWRQRPFLLTAYRGTCASDDEAIWKGVSWSPDPDYAASYASTRTRERYDLGEHTGWPRLVKAKLPYDSVLAIVDNGREILVDHEKLRSYDVEEVAPLAPARINEVKAYLIADAAATFAKRATLGMAGRLSF